MNQIIIIINHGNTIITSKFILTMQDMVELMTENYHLTVGSLAPDLARLYAPHLNKIRACLEPGMAQINWTCSTWSDFTTKTLNDVAIIKGNILTIIHA